MPRLLLLLTFCAFQIFLYGQPSDKWAKVKASKKGTLFCLWNESYGIAYTDEKGRLRGVCVDVLDDFVTYVHDKYGVDLQLRFEEEKSFEKFLSRIEAAPSILGVSSISITEDRKKRFSFSPYFLSNPNVLVTHRDAPKLVSLDNIASIYKDYTLRVVSGSTHLAFAKSLKEKHFSALKIEQATSSRSIFDEIAKNNTLFTIIDFGEYLGAYKNKLPLTRQPVNLGIDDKLAFAMAKQSDWEPVWREFLNDEYRKSARYRKIIADNLGLAYLGMIQ